MDDALLYNADSTVRGSYLSRVCKPNDLTPVVVHLYIPFLSSPWLPRLLSCFFFPSGKRRFKFGRRGSPSVALSQALELDIRVRT